MAKHLLPRLAAEARLQKIWPFVAAFAVFLLLESGYFALQDEFATRLPFGVQIAHADYGLAEIESVKSALMPRIKAIYGQTLQIQIDGETYAVEPRAIDLAIQTDTLTSAAQELIALGELQLAVELDTAKLEQVLLAQNPNLIRAERSAAVQLDAAGELVIQSEIIGQKVDFGELAKQIRSELGYLRSPVFVVNSTPVQPRLVSTALVPFRAQLAELVRRPLVLKVNEYTRFTIPLAERLGWFDFVRRVVVAGEILDLPESLREWLPESAQPALQLDRVALEQFVKNELTPLVAIAPRAVSITQDLSGQFTFEGVAIAGREVDTAALVEQIRSALATESREVTVPFVQLPAPVQVAPQLEQLGIRELVGSAVTDYSGSPRAREYNIALAATKLNGRLITPGAEFSFVSEIGEITTGAGYRQGLVIKEGDIIPEVGGGVCQVSTTIFRSALASGLPITAQRPHSFKVVYYDPPGLDATIYPGSVDLRFANDTGHPLLMQTFVEGSTVRVNFYGTRDGRESQLVGPLYPDGSPVLELGKAGRNLLWKRILRSSSGEAKEEKYFANYKIMPKH